MPADLFQYQLQTWLTDNSSFDGCRVFCAARLPGDFFYSLYDNQECRCRLGQVRSSDALDEEGAVRYAPFVATPRTYMCSGGFGPSASSTDVQLLFTQTSNDAYTIYAQVATQDSDTAAGAASAISGAPTNKSTLSLQLVGLL